MATPQDLDRLRALLGQLTQIGAARRGELIHAEAWNTLVGALADVARAVLAAEASVAVSAHKHLDQVDSAWLAPSLRELLERGPLADPAMQQRLATIEQTLRRLGEVGEASGGRIEEFRGRLTDVASRDLERQSAITAVRRQLDTVLDPRADLQAMRNSLGAVQRDISTVLDAASKLSVNGQTVDIGAVVGRVTELEQLRERLRLSNGELLDAATVERRLAEVDQRAVRPEALTEALNSHQFQLSDAQTTALEDRLGTRQREQTNTVLDAFRAETDTRVNTRLDGLGALVQGRVTDALPGLETSLTTALGGRIDAAQQAAVAAAQQAAQGAIDASAAGVRAALGAQIEALDASLTRQVDSQVTQGLADGLGALASRLDAAGTRLDALGGQLGQVAETQNAHAAQLAGIPQDMAALRTELKKGLLDEISLRVAAVNRTLDERLATFARDNDLKLNAMRGEISAQAVDAARKAAVETAQANSAGLRTQLLAEMRGIARDELSVAVNDSVRSSVNSAVATQFAALPNLVTEEVKRQKLVVRPDSPATPIRPGRTPP